MKQLSGIDHLFLQMERGNQFMHVAALGIYDPSTSPGGSVRFRDVLKFFGARIAEFPQFRRRLVTVPLSIDRPYWVEDAAFDLEFHVRHIALPQPGDWRQLCIQVARLAFPPARSQQAALGGVRHRRSRQRGRRAGRQFRAVHEGPPCADRWRVGFGDHARDPLAHARRRRRGGTAADGTHRRARSSAFEIYARAFANNLARLPTLTRFSLRTASRVATAGASYAARTATNREQIKTGLLSLITGDLST
jgi:hypothetical protein